MSEKVYIRLSIPVVVDDGEVKTFVNLSRVTLGHPDDPWFREEFTRDCLEMLDELHAAAKAEQR